MVVGSTINRLFTLLLNTEVRICPTVTIGYGIFSGTRGGTLFLERADAIQIKRSHDD